MTTLPTGETLPDYDDGPADGVDIDKLLVWLRGNNFGARWGFHVDPAVIRDVLAALQAVGDATLVKNATYRAMRKEGADIERLAARLANTGYAARIIECGGPVDAALSIVTDAGKLADVMTTALRNVAAGDIV